MAYVKAWAPRSFNALELREPAAVPGPAGTVTRADALELDLGAAECAYLDPPYNQHSYFSNYHVWETLIRWDAPEHYGIACKRVDCRTTKSPFNRRREAGDALAGLVERLPARGSCSPAPTRASTTSATSSRCWPSAGTCARWRSPSSATSARRSASSTRRAGASARSRICATPSCCSSPGRTRRSRRPRRPQCGGDGRRAPAAA